MRDYRSEGDNRWGRGSFNSRPFYERRGGHKEKRRCTGEYAKTFQLSVFLRNFEKKSSNKLKEKKRAIHPMKA